MTGDTRATKSAWLLRAITPILVHAERQFDIDSLSPVYRLINCSIIGHTSKHMMSEYRSDVLITQLLLNVVAIAATLERSVIEV